MRLPELRLPPRPRPSLGVPRLRLGAGIPPIPMPPAPALFPPRLDCDAARAVDVCLCPRTEAEEVNCRLQRILRQPPPPPAPRASIMELLERRLDDILRHAPAALRGPLRSAARAAVERGTEALVNAALDRPGISGEVREAVRAAVKAALRTPVLRAPAR